MSGVGITYLWTSREFPPFIRLEGKRGDYETYYPSQLCRTETQLLAEMQTRVWIAERQRNEAMAALTDEGIKLPRERTCECAEGMSAYADSLCDPLKEQMDKLLRCLENDYGITASWDGLRKVWRTESTQALERGEALHK